MLSYILLYFLLNTGIPRAQDSSKLFLTTPQLL